MAERGTRRRFTAEFKAAAVKRLLDGGKGLSEVATELGLSPGQLSAWRAEHLAAGSADALAARKAEQAELQRLKREDRRQVVVYIITHGQCHIPTDVVQQLRREAYLYGVFILPSSEMTLEYLELLNRHQIVDDKTLQSKKDRRDRALQIVQDAG